MRRLAGEQAGVRRWLARFAVPCLFIGFFLWFGALRLLQHYSFRTNAYDLSIFDYGLYYTLKGCFLWTPFLAVDEKHPAYRKVVDRHGYMLFAREVGEPRTADRAARWAVSCRSAGA